MADVPGFDFGETFQKSLTDAIVRQFFDSTNPNGYTDANGMYHPPRISPVSQVVHHMLHQNNDDLVNAIIEKLDLDAIAEKISKQVVDDLTTRVKTSSWHQTQDERRREAMQKKIDDLVTDKVAAKLAEQMVSDRANKNGLD